MDYDTHHEPYNDYKPTPEQKKCRHRNAIRTEGRFPYNILEISPDFFYNICSDCGARGYDGLWIVIHYSDSDAHDFCYGHSKEDCKGH